LDEMEKRRAELRATIERLRKRVREAEADVSRAMVVPRQSVEARRWQLESELAAKRPRLQALKKVQSQAADEDGGVGNALRELVAARESLAAGLEKAVAQGKRDPIELLRARAELAEARVRATEWG